MILILLVRTCAWGASITATSVIARYWINEQRPRKYWMQTKSEINYSTQLQHCALSTHSKFRALLTQRQIARIYRRPRCSFKMRNRNDNNRAKIEEYFCKKKVKKKINEETTDRIWSRNSANKSHIFGRDRWSKRKRISTKRKMHNEREHNHWTRKTKNINKLKTSIATPRICQQQESCEMDRSDCVRMRSCARVCTCYAGRRSRHKL